jgi:hypothetical protein
LVLCNIEKLSSTRPRCIEAAAPKRSFFSEHIYGKIKTMKKTLSSWNDVVVTHDPDRTPTEIRIGS